jgi:hypothetical protein
VDRYPFLRIGSQITFAAIVVIAWHSVVAIGSVDELE